MAWPWLATIETAVFAFTESVTCWDIVLYEKQLLQWTCIWCKAAHWSVGYNRIEKHPDKIQPGSTRILVTNLLTHRAQKPGDNPVSLVDGAGSNFKGSSIKSPILFQCTNCVNPMAQWQHINNMYAVWQNKIELCVQERQCWRIWLPQSRVGRMKGTQHYSFYGYEWRFPVAIVKFFSDLGLMEVLFHIHGNQAPATHNHSRLPIDGIYLLQHLCNTAKGCYFTFGEGVPSNHSELWLDLPIECICVAESACLHFSMSTTV